MIILTTIPFLRFTVNLFPKLTATWNIIHKKLVRIQNKKQLFVKLVWLFAGRDQKFMSLPI